jgi:protein SCO1
MKGGILHLRSAVATISAAACLLSMSPAASAQINQKQVPSQAQGLDVEEKQGTMLPLDTPLTNSRGEMITLGKYFNTKNGSTPRPVVLALVYYDCPVVCSAVMDKMRECFDKLDYTPGHEFNCVMISFDDRETTAMAAEKKAYTLSVYGRPVDSLVQQGWEFHTGAPEAVRAIADATGFRYRQLENGEFSHPVCIFVITPEGRVSRYFYGFEYPARDMKLALIEASEGKLAKSLGDRFLQFCYMYDPSLGAYSLQAMRIMQAGGVVSAGLVFGTIGVLWTAERRKRRRIMAAKEHRRASPSAAARSSAGMVAS